MKAFYCTYEKLIENCNEFIGKMQLEARYLLQLAMDGPTCLFRKKLAVEFKEQDVEV